jgi:hypothetical protein
MGMELSRLPRKLLEALSTCEDGGALYSVATSPHLAHPLPCFIVRSPVSKHAIAKTPLYITAQLKVYELEGPLTIFHLYLHDLPPEIDLVVRPHALVSIRMTPKNPFELECFLNPTDEFDREVLEALAGSPLIHVEFFLIGHSMPYQGAKHYPNPAQLQQAAKEALERTQAMPSSMERFLAAKARFLAENPLFS